MRHLHTDVRGLWDLIRNDRTTKLFTLIMLAVTVLAIAGPMMALHFLAHGRYAADADQLLRLGRENGVQERFIHGLSFVAASMFLTAFLDSKSRLSLAFAVLFAFIWFDDSMQYHERFGQIIARAVQLPVPTGLREQDIAELIAWAVAASALAPVFFLAWLGRRPGESAIAVLVAACFALLVFFATFFDLIHSIAPLPLQFASETIEESGEIVTLALVASLALGVARNARAFFGEDARLASMNGAPSSGVLTSATATPAE